MSNNTPLIDGQQYKFQYEGYNCCGTFLLSEDNTEGKFYNLGKAICKTSQAQQIERVYSEAELNKKVADMVADSLVITDKDGNTVDYEWREGIVEIQ
ncbi:hypothetical protein F7U66_01110 [Vibrio parahaemolyticus]|nr:hypothetical protein [Vibrio parahaemolyticus]